MAKRLRAPSAVPQENTCQQRRTGSRYTVDSTCASIARGASFHAVATQSAKAVQLDILMAEHIKVPAHADQAAATAALLAALAALAVIVIRAPRDGSRAVAWARVDRVLLDAFLLKKRPAGVTSARRANLTTVLPTLRSAMAVRAAHLAAPGGIPVAVRHTAPIVLQGVSIQESRMTSFWAAYTAVRALAAQKREKRHWRSKMVRATRAKG